MLLCGVLVAKEKAPAPNQGFRAGVSAEDQSARLHRRKPTNSERESGEP